MRKLFLCMSLVFAAVTYNLRAQEVIPILNESFENGIPATWSQEALSGNQLWSVEDGKSGYAYPSGAVAGQNRAYLRNSTGETQGYKTRLITPVMDLEDVYQPILRFYHAQVKWTGDFDTLRVWYKNSEKGVWRLLSEYAQPYPAWSKEQIDLPQPTSYYQLCFEGAEHMGRGIVLDSVLVRAKPQCTVPHDLSVTNMGEQAVTLNWIASYDANDYQVILAKADNVFDIDTIDIEQGKKDGLIVQDIKIGSGTMFQHRFKQLETKCNYIAFVRSLCDLETSDWGVLSFYMKAMKQIPYEENFNMELASGQLKRIQSWTYGNNTEKYNPFINTHQTVADARLYVRSGTALCFTGGNNVGNGFDIQGGQYVYAVTPEIYDSVAGVDFRIQDCQARFWLSLGAYGSFRNKARGLIVGLAEDPQDPTTFTPIDTIRLWKYATYEEFTVSFENYQGDGRYVVFLSWFDEPNQIYMDDLTIEKRPLVKKVYGINVMPLDTTAVITWDNVAVNYNLIISDYETYRPDTLPAANKLLEAQVSEPVFETDKLLAGQKYFVYVQASGGEWSNPYQFRTACSLENNKIVVGFEDEEGYYEELNHGDNKVYKFPSCVQTFSTDPQRPATSIMTTASNAHNGSKVLALSMDAGRDAWAVFPPVTDTIIQDMEIELYARCSSSTYYKSTWLAVGIMTNPSDISTFEQVFIYNLSSTTYTRIYTNFENYEGEGKYIAIRWMDSEDGSIGSSNCYPYIDDVTIQPLGTCVTPKVSVDKVSTTSATLSWSAKGMTTFDIVIDSLATRTEAALNSLSTETNGVQYVGQVSDVKTFDIPEGLLTWRNYAWYAYVRSVCGENEKSYWTSPIRFALATPEKVTVPYVEDFEYSETGTGTAAVGWKHFRAFGKNSTSSSYPYVYSSTTYSNSGHSSLYLYSYRTGTTLYGGYAFAPLLDVDDMSHLKVTFSGRASSAASSPTSTGTTYYVDSLYIGVAPVQGDTAGITWLDTISVPTTTHTEYYTLLSDWKPQMGRYIVFSTYHPDSVRATTYNSLYLDDISFESMYDIKPFDVEVTDVGDQSATFEWKGEATAGWNVVVTKEPVNPDTVGNVVADKVIIRDSVITVNPFTVTGLSPQTNYYFYIKPVEGDAKSWSEGLNVLTNCLKLKPYAGHKETFEGKYGNTQTTSGWKYYEAPDCWTITGTEHPTSTSYQSGMYVYSGTSTSTSTYAHEGKAGMRIYGSNSTTASYFCNCAWLATPELDVTDMSTITLEFWMKSGSTTAGTYIFRIGIMSDPNDYSTFHEVWSKQMTSTNWTKYEVAFSDLDLSGATGKYIAFATNEGKTNYYYLDEISISASYCKAANPVLTKLGSDSVRLTYAAENVDMRVILVKDSAFDVDLLNAADNAAYLAKMTADTILVNDTIIRDFIGWQIRGLESDQDYHLALQTQCQEETAKWKTVSFHTLCEAVNMKDLGLVNFESGFNDTTAFTSSSVTWRKPMNNCWVSGNKVTSDQTYVPYVFKGAVAPDGEKALRFYSTTALNGAYAIMPAIDIDSIRFVEVAFKMGMTNPGSAAKPTSRNAYAYGIIVGVTTDPSDLSTFVAIDTVYTPDFDSHDYIVRFNDYKGDFRGEYGKYITFLSEFDATNAVTIDNVKVDSISACGAPVKFRANNITDNSAELSWSTPAKSVRLMITTSSIDPANWDKNTENVVINDTIEASNYKVTGLNGVTMYYVYIKSLCDEGDGNWILDEASFKTDCPVAAQLPYVEDFDGYASGTKNHPSCWVSYYNGLVDADASYPYVYATAKYGTTGNGFYFYNASTYAAPEKRATTATMPIAGDVSRASISFNYKASSSSTYPGQLLIGLASDVSTLDKLLETVQYFDTVVPAKSSTAWEDYYYDMKDLSGTNMHIVMSINYQASVSTSSIYLDNFKVEKTPTCFTPSIQADSIGTNSVKFLISPYFETDNAWDIRVISEDKSDTIVRTAEDTAYVLTGLQPKSMYYYQVRTNCGDGDLSAWSEQSELNTLWVIGCGQFYGFETKDEPWIQHPNTTSSGYTLHPSLTVGNYSPAGVPATSYTYIPYQYQQTATAQRARTGDGFMYIYNTSSYPYAYVMFPEIEGADTLQISFDMRSASVNAGDTILDTNTYPFAKIVLATIDESGDISTLKKFASFGVSSYELGEKVTEKKNLLFDHVVAPLPDMTGKRLVMMQDVAVTSYVYVDNVLFSKKSGYITPSIGKAVVSPTSLTLNWEANGASKWNVYLVDSNDAFPLDSVAAGDIVAQQTGVTAQTVTFDGLTPNKTYYAFLQVADAEGLGATSVRKRYLLPQTEKIASDSIIGFEGINTKKYKEGLYSIFPNASTVGDSLYAMSIGWYTGNEVQTTHSYRPWARLNGYYATGTTAGTSYKNIKVARSGQRALQLYNTVAGLYIGAYAAMPLVDVGFDTIQVNFYARPFYENNSGKVGIAGSTYKDKPLLVGTMTDPNDPATFEVIDSLYYANTTYTTSTDVGSEPDAGWQRMSFRLKGANGQYVAFAAPVAGQWYIDDISFGVRTCLTPNKVTAVDITGHTALLKWNIWDETAPCRLQVASVSTMADNVIILDTLLTVTPNSYLIEGLEGVTKYFYRVRQECSETEQSAWTRVYDFTTACSETDGHHVYTFESGEGYALPSGTTSTTYYYPQCWTVGNTYTASTSTYSYNARIQNSSGSSWYSYNPFNPVGTVPQGQSISNTSLRLYSYLSSSGEDYSYLQWAAMPELSMAADMDTLQLSFYALPGAYNPVAELISTTYTGNTYFPAIMVGVMSDPDDYSTFHALDTLVYERELTLQTMASPANDYMFQHFVVSLKNARQYGNYITFVADYKTAMEAMPEKAEAWTNASSTYAYVYMFIDNVRFEKLNECKTPTSLLVSDITESAAKLTWETDGGEKWIVRVSSDATFPDTAMIFNDTIAEKYLQLSDLKGFTGDNYYYWTVQQMCDASTLSPRSQVQSFHTAYIPMYDEKFMLSPTEWKIDSTRAISIFAGNPFSNKSSYPWTRHTSSNHYGMTGPHMYGQMNSGNPTATSPTTYVKKSWMITPSIYLADDKDAWLTFTVAMTYYSSNNAPDLNGWDDQFMVVISDDNGETWKRENAIIWNNETSNNPDDEHYIYGIGDKVLNDLPSFASTNDPQTIDLSAYKGKMIKIGFYYESTVLNAYNYIHVGNVHVNYLAKVEDAMTTCQYEDQEGCNGIFIIDGDKAAAGLTEYQRIHLASLDDLRDDPNAPLIDSLYTFQSNYTEAPSAVISTTICEGESAGAEWGFENRSEAGVYLRKGISKVTGCDSITTFNLTVIPRKRVEIEENICSGVSYEFNGVEYNKTGVYTDTLTSVVTGCDSIVTLILTVNPPITYEYEYQICRGSSYYFTPKYPSLSVNGTFMDTVKTAAGCDSIVTLNLSVVDQIELNLYDTICEGDTYNFEGQNYSKEGTYTVTLTSVAGCDSVRTLHLAVGKRYETNIEATICPGKRYQEYGFDVTEPGSYSLNLQTKWGCDSIINLTLEYSDVDTIRVDTLVYASALPYFYENTSITYPLGTPAGVYVDTINVISTTAACDYVLIHTLTIEEGGAIDNINYSELMLRPSLLNAGEKVVADYNFTVADLANLKVEVYDIVGRCVESTKYTNKPVIIDAFETAGVYTVRITSGTGLNLVGRVVVR